MKKEYIIGGLALLGAIGVIAYLSKPKRNSEGFYNATGRGITPQTFSRQGCAFCKSTVDGDIYHTGGTGRCKSGDSCSSPYAVTNSNPKNFNR
jgi:hypothetical protein